MTGTRIHASTAHGAAPPTASAVVRARIVIADDNDDLLQMLAWFLEGEGFEVHAGVDGREAMRLAEIHRPDVMILDLGMPEIDGYETAKAVRSEPWGDDTKLVAHSGYGRREDEQRALAAGFDVHVTKPADPQALVDLIERLCSTRES
jgi:CheY-like chemotaxis protein